MNHDNVWTASQTVVQHKIKKIETMPRALCGTNDIHFVASELKDPICHSDECQIGSFSSEATIYNYVFTYIQNYKNSYTSYFLT